MRCAFVLLLIERSSTLMPTPPASMPRRSSGVKRAASEPTAEPQPAAAPEPDTRPTSYDNKYNWTANAQAPMGATTAQNRLAALKAAAENDERIIACAGPTRGRSRDSACSSLCYSSTSSSRSRAALFARQKTSSWRTCVRQRRGINTRRMYEARWDDGPRRPRRSWRATPTPCPVLWAARGRA